MTLQQEEKRWIRPQLTVLVRNHPQEQILSACKGSGITGGNPAGIRDQCAGAGGMACADCYTLGLS